ncbi:MAG: MarR family transcriptional regulator [Cyclobacteriaceae bacterium]
MRFDSSTETIFYTIEQTIKEYRKFAHKKIGELISDLSLDQALILIIISENPKLLQVQIAELIFKDYASITRMLDLMVKNGYLKREANEEDRRRSHLRITTKGGKAIDQLQPIILKNRKTALNGLSEKEINTLEKTLKKIVSNCNP